jgi:hypothetical protein
MRGVFVKMKEAEKRLVLNEQETRLIQMIRDMKYGEIHIFVAEGKPIRPRKSRKA